MGVLQTYLVLCSMPESSLENKKAQLMTALIIKQFVIDKMKYKPSY